MARRRGRTLPAARLLAALDACHRAQALGEPLSQPERRELFEAFFLWEQAAIVGRPWNGPWRHWTGR